MKRLAQIAAVVMLGAACTGASKTKDTGAKPAAATTKAAKPQKFPVVVKSDAAGTCEAIFEGEAPPKDLDAPLEYGTSRLYFMFKGEKAAIDFKPQGELYFSDWRFDLFSPDGKYVALLQDRFGPYHIVAVERLAAYLQGKAQPDKVVTEQRPDGQAALVHQKGHWVSPSEFEYEVAGETAETKRASVP